MVDMFVHGFAFKSADDFRGIGTVLQKLMRIHQYGPHGYEMLTPLLGFLYIIATILQIAVACIMCKGCSGVGSGSVKSVSIKLLFHMQSIFKKMYIKC
jgi:hypothetical protein